MKTIRKWQQRVASLGLVFLAVLTCSGAELLKDINTTPIGASSYPRYLGVAGSKAIFIAGRGVASSDYGLWVTDGTTAGTSLLISGDSANSMFGNAEPLATLGSRVLWFGRNSSVSVGLWASDGTTAGTLKLANVSSSKHGVVATLPNNVLIFATLTSGGPTELWRTDGTVSGTWRLAVFDTTPSEDLPQGAVLQGRVFFSATTTLGTELWVTDGSNNPSQTHLEMDLEAGSGSSDPRQITAVGANIYFTVTLANSGIPQLWRRDAGGNFQALTSSGMHAQILCAGDTFLIFHVLGEPWRTDGTLAGTFDLIAPGQTPFDSIGPCVSAGAKVYFNGGSFATTPVLWESNGTVAGTKVVPIGATPTNPVPVLWTGTHLFFTGYDSVTGVELWITDGTLGSTHMVMDAFPTGGSTSFIQSTATQVFVQAAQFVYKFPDDELQEIWRMDLDGEHPLRLTRNVSVDPYGFDSLRTFVANDRIFFTSRADSSVGNEPSASDGTLTGTMVLRNIAVESANLDSSPGSFVTLKTNTLFFSDDGIHGRELWQTDGSVIGTRLLFDVRPDAASSNGVFVGVFDEVAYFVANDGTHGKELWRTDGTVAGTRMITDIEPGLGDGPALEDRCRMLKLGSSIYFAARTSTAGVELWRTDGTGAGTELVADIAPGSTNSNACPLGVVGSKLYFSASDSRGPELWVTDGTSAGTSIVADLVPGAVGATPLAVTEFQGAVAFTANPVANTFSPRPRQLWTLVNGEPRLVMDVTASPPATITFVLPRVDGLYFGVVSGQSPGIYRWTGGLEAPVRVVSTVRPVGNFASTLGDRFVFLGISTAEGCELFISDGTETNTSAITSFSPTSVCTVSSVLAVYGQTAYFNVFSPDNVVQLARTNGTLADTQLLTNFSGSFCGFNNGLALASGQIVFAANDCVSNIGLELFIEHNQSPQTNEDTLTTAANQSQSVAVIANDTDPDGKIIATSVRIVSPPQHGEASVTSSGSIVYKPASDYLGLDLFRYVVADNAGAESAPTKVTVTVTTPPPANPTPSPTPTPASPPAQQSGGGGGAVDPFVLMSLFGAHYLRNARRSSRKYRAAQHRRSSVSTEQL